MSSLALSASPLFNLSHFMWVMNVYMGLGSLAENPQYSVTGVAPLITCKSRYSVLTIAGLDAHALRC